MPIWSHAGGEMTALSLIFTSVSYLSTHSFFLNLFIWAALGLSCGMQDLNCGVRASQLRHACGI